MQNQARPQIMMAENRYRFPFPGSTQPRQNFPWNNIMTPGNSSYSQNADWQPVHMHPNFVAALTHETIPIDKDADSRSVEQAVEPETQVYPKGYGKTRPVFLCESLVFNRSTSTHWITGEEVFLSMAQTIPRKNIKGVQRIGKFWRLYVLDEQDRITLLSKGLNFRGKHVTLCPENPNIPKYERGSTTRLKISSVPLSADDRQIVQALVEQGCTVRELHVYREKLRVQDQLTDCDTGNRVVIVNKLSKHMPKLLIVGKYSAGLWYYGQPKENQPTTDNMSCTKCLGKDHRTKDCVNDIICNRCLQPGHKALDCECDLQADDENASDGDSAHDAQNSDDEADDEDGDSTNGEDTQSGKSKKPKFKPADRVGRVRVHGRRTNSSKGGSPRQRPLDGYLSVGSLKNSDIAGTPNKPRSASKQSRPASSPVDSVEITKKHKDSKTDKGKKKNPNDNK